MKVTVHIPAKNSSIINCTHHFKGTLADIQFQFRNKYGSADFEIDHNCRSFRHFCLSSSPFDFDKFKLHSLLLCEEAEVVVIYQFRVEILIKSTRSQKSC